MVRQSENDKLSVTRFLFSCEIAGYSLLLGSPRFFFHFYFSLKFHHLRFDGLSDQTIHSSLWQSWWLTRVISNHLDILPKQQPLWENIQILSRAPIISRFLQDCKISCTFFPTLPRDWEGERWSEAQSQGR